MPLKMKELSFQSNESKSTILYYIKEGLLPQPSKPKPVEVAEVLERANNLGLDCSLLDDYVVAAKTLANKENEVGATLLKDDEDSHNARYELLFDLVLTLKPYIFNMHTVQAHQNNIQKDA